MNNNLIRIFRQGVLNVVPKCDRSWVREQFRLQDEQAKIRQAEEDKRARKIKQMIRQIAKELDE